MISREKIQRKIFPRPTGRDPEKFLGIDGNVIPWKYFTGIYAIDQCIFSDDNTGRGILFMYSREKKGCEIIDQEPDLYVTANDLRMCNKWFIINQHVTEFDESETKRKNQEYDDLRKGMYADLIRKYHNTTDKIIRVERKVYNDNMEYMPHEMIFERDKGNTLVEKLQNHIDLMYMLDDHIKPEDRHIEVKAKPELIEDIKTAILMDYAVNGKLMKTNIDYTEYHYLGKDMEIERLKSKNK